MRLILILFTSLIFLAASCKKDKPEITQKADITLSSKALGDMVYYKLGYSFELQKYVKTILSNEISDIYLIEELTTTGNLTGARFASKEVAEHPSGFYLNNSFTNSADALQFYENYNIAIAPQISILTDTVKANQVWTFKTWMEHYVKILIKDVRKASDGSSIDFMEVDIKYFIQRDGSTNLTE